MFDPQLVSIAPTSDAVSDLKCLEGGDLPEKQTVQVPIYQRGLANFALARSPKRHVAIKVVACDRNRDSLCPRFCIQLRASR